MRVNTDASASPARNTAKGKVGVEFHGYGILFDALYRASPVAALTDLTQATLRNLTGYGRTDQIAYFGAIPPLPGDAAGRFRWLLDLSAQTFLDVIVETIFKETSADPQSLRMTVDVPQRGDWFGNGFSTILAGNDTIIGSPFADTLAGGNGDDTTGGGNDTVDGGSDRDVILGGGRDRIDGSWDADTVKGGGGNDRLFGGGGDDALTGEAGRDRMVGGNGADRFGLVDDDRKDVIVDFDPAEGDRLLIEGLADFDDLAIRDLANGSVGIVFARDTLILLDRGDVLAAAEFVPE